MVDGEGNGGVYDFMLFSDPYIEIFLQEIKTVREKHKIIDAPFLPTKMVSLSNNKQKDVDFFLIVVA
jgi:hypothetical protein